MDTLGSQNHIIWAVIAMKSSDEATWPDEHVEVHIVRRSFHHSEDDHHA